MTISLWRFLLVGYVGDQVFSIEKFKFCRVLRAFALFSALEFVIACGAKAAGLGSARFSFPVPMEGTYGLYR